MKKQNTSLLIIAMLMILIAAISRLVLYPNNLSPIIGMSLFAGAVIKDKKLAFAMPLLAMFLSDVMFEVFNVAQGFWGWWQLLNYGALALITCFGFFLKKINVINVTVFSIISTLAFYLLSNTISYFVDLQVYHLYATNFSGYIDCMKAGIPFMEKGLLVDLSYCAVLFGGYYLLEKEVFNKANVG